MKTRVETVLGVPTGSRESGSAESGYTESRAKLGWLIRLRWIALLGQALSSVVGLQLGYLAKAFFGLYASVVFCSAIWNLISKKLYYKRKSQVTLQDLAVQLLADIGSLTLLLSMTGGIYNPLCSLLLIHAVLAALLLEGLSLILILGLICGSLAFLQWNPDVSHLSITESVTRPVLFLSYSFVALFVAGLTAWLSRTLTLLQKNMKTLQQQQERMDRLKVAGAMAAGFSHEFATPLYNLKLRVGRILRKTSPQGSEEIRAVDKSQLNQLNEDAQSAYEAILECESILREMTQLGLKADQLKLDQSKAKDVFNDFIREFIETHSAIQFDFINSLSENSEIELPSRPFKQTIFDLLENAEEFSTPGRPIRIRLKETPNQLHMIIENEGEEISPLVLEKWGEPFVTTKPNGTGLGLFNAITLSQAMGGDLRASRINQSITRLELSLPLASQALGDEYKCP